LILNLKFEFVTNRTNTNFTVSLTNTTSTPSQNLASFTCRAAFSRDNESAANYRVWASLWNGNEAISPSDEENPGHYGTYPPTSYDANGWSGAGLTAIVPALYPQVSYNTDYVFDGITYDTSSSFGNYRRPDDSNSGGINGSIDQLKQNLDLNPDGRRVLRNQFYSGEYSAQVRANATTNMNTVIPGQVNQGYTYSYEGGESRIFSIHPGYLFDSAANQNRQINPKLMVEYGLNKMAQGGISFEWVMNKQDFSDFWHLFGYNSAFGISANGLPIDSYSFDVQGKTVAAFSPLVPDARVVSGTIQDSRTSLARFPQLYGSIGLNPINVASLQESFWLKFIQLLAVYDISYFNYSYASWTGAFGPLAGITGITASTSGGIAIENVWTEYSPTVSQFGTSLIPGGYTLVHIVAPAWDAAVDAVYYGGYIYDTFNRHFRGSSTPVAGFTYATAKMTEFDLYPVAYAESRFTSYSNARKRLGSTFPENGSLSVSDGVNNYGRSYSAMGEEGFCLVPNNRMLSERLLPSGITYIDVSGYSVGNYRVPVEVLRIGSTAGMGLQSNIDQLGTAWNLPGTTTEYTNLWNSRSGYYRTGSDPLSPVRSLNDYEKFTWGGNGNTALRYPSPEFNGTPFLIRYPITCPYATGGANLVLQTGITLDKFWNELSYKYLVDHVKQLRLIHRSDPSLHNFWTPWITDPSYPDTVFARGLTGVAGMYPSSSRPHLVMGSRPYWYEMMFHEILHGAEHIQHYQGELAIVNEGTLVNLQRVLSEWKTLSGNSKVVPVGRTAGTPDNSSENPIDRILLEEAFDKNLVSGGRIVDGPSAGWRLWRLTAPAHLYSGTGTAEGITLSRVGTDLNFPANIFLRRYNQNGTESLTGGRGTWITTASTSPLPTYVKVDAPDVTPGDVDWSGIVDNSSSSTNFVESNQQQIQGINQPISLSIGFTGTWPGNFGSGSYLRSVVQRGSGEVKWCAVDILPVEHAIKSALLSIFSW